MEDSSGGVSRAHAALFNSSSATFLVDLDSAHGTWLDEDGRLDTVPQLGRRLPSDEPTKLLEGQSFRLGTSRYVFRVVGVEPVTIERWMPPPWSEAPPSKAAILEIRFENSNPYLQVEFFIFERSLTQPILQPICHSAGFSCISPGFLLLCFVLLFFCCFVLYFVCSFVSAAPGGGGR